MAHRSRSIGCRFPAALLAASLEILFASALAGQANPRYTPAAQEDPSSRVIPFAVESEVCSDAPAGTRFLARSIDSLVTIVDHTKTVPDTFRIPPRSVGHLQVIPRPYSFPDDWNGVLNVFMDSVTAGGQSVAPSGDVVAAEISRKGNLRCLARGASIRVYIGRSGSYHYAPG
jgi:hypothetical protein